MRKAPSSASNLKASRLVLKPDETARNVVKVKEDKTEGEILQFFTANAVDQPLSPVLNDNNRNHWVSSAKAQGSLRRLRYLLQKRSWALSDPDYKFSWAS